MKNYTSLFLAVIITITSFGQDLIIKRNGEEIPSKVLEVNLTIIKYKKFDNLNGPTFEIQKSEVFIIKYENGTKDIIYPLTEISNETSVNKNNSSLAFTEKHRSTTIAYGLSALFGGITDYGSGQSATAIGPLIICFDKALSEKFSLSFRPAIMYYTENVISIYNSNSSLLFGGLQIRIDYHFATSKNIDPYFGIGGGLGYFFGGNYLSGINGSYPLIGGGFGMKYYGNGKDALLVELGFDSFSYLKIGYVFGRHK